MISKSKSRHLKLYDETAKISQTKVEEDYHGFHSSTEVDDTVGGW